MTRQEELKEIGEMIPNDFVSHFIIPIPHKFYKNDSDIFSKIRKTKWNVINDISKFPSRQLGAFNIKSYIYENMISPLDEKNHIDRYSSLLLKRSINKQARIDNFLFNIKEIDLWIFDEHVSFFTIIVDIDCTNYTVNELSEFNRQFREFKFLDIKEKDDEFIFSRVKGFQESDNGFFEYLIALTMIDNKSFLNINKSECTNMKDKNNKHNSLYTIYNTSTNAKVLTATQTQTSKFSNGKEIEPLHESDLHYGTINGTSTLEEVPFYLASCSSLNPAKGFTNNEGYIYSLVDNGGFNIWKYSSGLTIHDSFALFGLSNDGGPVVANTKNQFYFIYILNLYINFQSRFIENKLINEEFESLDINYWYKKLQRLKNQFVTQEVGVKFQENEIHTSMFSALKTEEMLSEITDNLMETREITQNNLGMYMTLIGFIFFSVLEEPITNLVSKNLEIIIPTFIILFVVWLKKKRFIKKYIKDLKSKFI